MIVHLGTRIETLFGVLDDNGNLIEQIPLKQQTAQLTEENFARVIENAIKQWETLKKEKAPDA